MKINYNGSSKVIKRLCERVNSLPILGTRHEDAFYGDLGQTAYDHSQMQSGNPHNVTLDDLGIANLPNQVRLILEAIGSLDYWVTHNTDEYIVDHEGDNLIFVVASNILAWH